MPPLPGEERLLTVFADIHYYFTTPNPKPLLHRFDKGSYLYLYHDATQHKTRIEVANNPGTPDQDAFNGGLNNVLVHHSTRFPTLCTLTVDGQTQTQGGLASPPPPSSADPYEWQLPTNDPRGENSIQRLHTLDVYFWTQGDADQFLDLTERYLSRGQVESDRQPVSASSETITTSTLVQQLENVAITDPAYQNGHNRNSQSMVVSPALPPPPPLSGAPSSTQQTTQFSPPPAEQNRDSAQFTPLPYNPAAPAAPEPIQHREKTPPPPDAADGTGLAAALAADTGAPYTTPSQIPGAGYAPPPPSSHLSQTHPGTPYSIPPNYASPPPSAGLTLNGSFPTNPPMQSPPGVGVGVPSYPQYHTGASHPPQQQQQQQAIPTYAPPPTDPNAHLYGTHGAHTLYGAQVPSIGGYSNYSYDQAPKHHHSGSGSEYDIHNQMYRPTEAEANSHLQKHAKLAMQNPGQRPRKLEESAARMENSVNRFLKKLEKKL